ncbi:helix-turn-helix protein [Haloactinopolyspora alba]|uniref:Helix-turn-helix protein n=1 Tax=Haloactinopolyspora alba TaxID=648780 RepID=A0A2P8DHH8_9ACTN|nr:helix-turn-helix transcriptional regulator [Haloactinopolyspora alba]PSK96666.1 helix-turn-helix protein [Haloactinopolyspora alba]
MPTGRRGAPSPVAKEIAAVLSRALSETKRTQGEIADQVGVSQSQLSKILRGDRQMDVDQLYMLSGALGIKARDVIHEAEEVTTVRRRVQDAGSDGSEDE